MENQHEQALSEVVFYSTPHRQISAHCMHTSSFSSDARDRVQRFTLALAYLTNPRTGYSP